MEWEQDISMFDWFFTPNNTSSKVIAITIGTIKYCYNNENLNQNNKLKSIPELIPVWFKFLFDSVFYIYEPLT